jgi:ankyrin repeat protein
MAIGSMPPIEYKPHIQFFKTEHIILITAICVISLLLTIIWFAFLMRYLRSKDASLLSLGKNRNKKNHPEIKIHKEIDYQSTDVDPEGKQDQTSLERAERNGHHEIIKLFSQHRAKE